MACFLFPFIWLKLSTKVMFCNLSVLISVDVFLMSVRISVDVFLMSVRISVDVFLMSNGASLTSSWNVMSFKCVERAALFLISKVYGSVARCSDIRTRCFASL